MNKSDSESLSKMLHLAFGFPVNCPSCLEFFTEREVACFVYVFDIAWDKKLKWSWILGRMNVFVTLKPRHERLIICIVPLLSFSLSFQFCLIRLVQPRSQTWDLLVCINLIKCVCDCYTFPAAESESMFVSLGPRHETLMSTSKATSACFALSWGEY